jgi:monoamine oxidase
MVPPVGPSGLFNVSQSLSGQESDDPVYSFRQARDVRRDVEADYHSATIAGGLTAPAAPEDVAVGCDRRPTNDDRMDR